RACLVHPRRTVVSGQLERHSSRPSPLPALHWPLTTGHWPLATGHCSLPPRLHPQLHRPLAARADLWEPNADRANIAIVLGRLQLAVLLDLERDDLKIRHPAKPLAPQLGGTILQPLVEE